MRTERGVALDSLLQAPDVLLHAPELCDVELLSVCRRGVLSRSMTIERARECVGDYTDLPIQRHAHTALLPRLLELHANSSAYDAVYVALSEVLGAELVTADAALARAVRRHTGVRTATD